MSNNIPLGILAASGGSYKWAELTGISDLVYIGGAYAPLTNASYFLFGRSTTGTNTTTYSRSSDGLSWATGTMPASTGWGKAAFNGTRLVATAYSSTTTGAYTTNGTTWTSTTIWGSSIASTDIIWDGTRFLVTGNSSTSNLAHSTDGATWTRIDIGNELNAIAYDGSSRYIALNKAASSTIRTTTGNPTVAGNWSDVSLPESQTWVSVSYGNGIWLISNQRDKAYTSTNGTTWTLAATSPTDLATIAVLGAERIFFYDGKFYLASGRGTVGQLIEVFSTVDGTSWTTEYSRNAVDGDYRKTAAWIGSPNFIFGAGFDNTTDGASNGVVATR